MSSSDSDLVAEYNFGQYLASSKVNYFIKPYGIFRDRNTQEVAVVMELAKGSEMFELLAYDMDEDQTKPIYFQLVDALVKMHKCGIYHRDLKPENIMYDLDSKQLKIVDYGQACLNRAEKKESMACRKNFTGGSPGYKVPVLLDEKVRFKYADIWPVILTILFVWLPDTMMAFRAQVDQGNIYVSPEYMFNYFLVHFFSEYGNPEETISEIKFLHASYGRTLPEITEKLKRLGKIDAFHLKLFEHLYLFFIHYIPLYAHAMFLSNDMALKQIVEDDSFTEDELEDLVEDLEQRIGEFAQMQMKFGNLSMSIVTKFSLEKLRLDLAIASGGFFVIDDDDCALPVNLINKIPEISLDFYRCKKEPLGSGTFGTVKRCTLKDTGRKLCKQDKPEIPLDTKYAIKFIHQ